MANGRGGTWGPGPAPTNQAPSPGYEYAQHTNPEVHGPTYDMVTSDLSGVIKDPQDAHFMGQLMPAAHPRPEEREFHNGMNVMG